MLDNYLHLVLYQSLFRFIVNLLVFYIVIFDNFIYTSAKCLEEAFLEEYN